MAQGSGGAGDVKIGMHERPEDAAGWRCILYIVLLLCSSLCLICDRRWDYLFLSCRSVQTSSRRLCPAGQGLIVRILFGYVILCSEKRSAAPCPRVNFHVFIA